MSNLAHFATRIIGVPLMMEPTRLDVILGVLGPRLGLDASDFPAPRADGPGDPKSRKPYTVTSDGIAVIDVAGSLVRKSAFMDAQSGLTSYADLENEFMDAITDPTIKGVLFDVDSGGGEAGGSFDLADLISSQRGAKPIYACANQDCMSAAYLLASAGDHLTVTRTGHIGSIGVVAKHADMSEANRMKGIKVSTITYGAKKANLSQDAPLTPSGQATLEDEVNSLGDMFVKTVAQNRGMTQKAVKDTQAAFYTGQRGVDMGLADQVGTFADALSAITQRVKGSQPITRRTAMPVAATVEIPKVKGETIMTEDEIKAAADAKEATEKAAQLAAAAQSAINLSADEMGEIAELCAMVGKPELTTKFYQAKTKPAQVRAELSKLRAEEGGQHTGSAVVAGQSTSSQFDNPMESPVVKQAEAAGRASMNPIQKTRLAAFGRASAV